MGCTASANVEVWANPHYDVVRVAHQKNKTIYIVEPKKQVRKVKFKTYYLPIYESSNMSITECTGPILQEKNSS